MKVSVVIATYNRASYVRQAINSVLSQTMQDFELIVVDDGSTDNTADALADFRDRIRYVRTENGGPASARNAGMALANGKYICWLDSDDYFHPAKLALQCAVLDRYPDIGMVYSNCSAFDDQGMWREFHLQSYHEPAYRRGGITYDKLFDDQQPISTLIDGIVTLPGDSSWHGRNLYVGNIFDSYMTHVVVFTNSMLFRKTAYEEIGPQQRRFGYFHDLEFALRLTRNRRVAFLDLPTYAIRYHPDQISTMVGPRAPRILLRKQQDLLRVLRVHGLNDREYYLANRTEIDRQIARLCRAAAQPMLAYDSGSAHESRYFPRRARAYLRYASKHGSSYLTLSIAARLPWLLRRVLMKLETVLHRLRFNRRA